MKATTHRNVVVKPDNELSDYLGQTDVDLEDVESSMAAQMEWDPQTDVASPMLPVQGHSHNAR